jgi:hypothetical protein
MKPADVDTCGDVASASRDGAVTGVQTSDHDTIWRDVGGRMQAMGVSLSGRVRKSLRTKAGRLRIKP